MNKNTFMYRTMKLHFNILVIAIILFSTLSEITAQEKNIITGYVYSSMDNTPIKGIKVSTKYRKIKSVTTSETGLFEINIPDTVKATQYVMFIFSYPGYEAKEQYGTLTDTMKVYMTPIDEYTFEKKVYYPYNNKKYTNMSSAVEPINVTYSTQVMSSTFEQLLENSTAQLTSASGAPGEGRTIKIRGYSTVFADEKPLVVIDGQVLGNYRFSETTIEGYYQDPLLNIDPRNIESITLLKDAATATLYGAKASNGVILIKTKDAKVGKTEFDITGHYGTNFSNKRLPVIQNSEYFKPYLLEQMYGFGYPNYDYFIEDPSFDEFYKYNKKTNWQDYVFEPGQTAGVNINVRGGDAIAKYFFSGGYLHDEGSVKNTNYNRFNARFNTNVDITRWLTTQAKMGITYSKSRLMQQGITYANPVYNSLIKAPFLYPYIIDSNNVKLPLTEDADGLGISNPYEVVNNSEVSISSYNFIGTLNFKFKISESFEANVRGSTELNKLNEFAFFPNHGFYNNDYPNYNQVKKGISNFSRTSTEFNLIYNRTFNEVHNLSGIVGLRTYYDEIIQDISSGVGTPSDEFKDLGLTIEDGRTKSGYQYFRKEFTDFLGLSYNYKEEYFVEVSLAADASSNIGRDAEPQYFGVPLAISPAIGLGWNISNLAGFNYNTFINYLKARISYGEIANTVYDPYISRNYYAPQQYYTATGYAKIMTENESLLWEKTQKADFGIDLVSLKQRLFVSADVYYHNTTGLLNNTLTEVEEGIQSWTNNGDMNTIGSELSIKLNAYEGPTLKWKTELSIGQYITKVANLDKDLIYDFGDGQKIFRNDEIAGSFYGYEVVKVISSDAEANALNLRHSNGTPFKAGDIQFKDNFEDGVIDDKDKVVIGNTTPDFYGSWVNKFTYMQFSLLVDVSFIYGNDLYNHTRRELESMDGYENQSKATLRRWQVDGQETDMPTAAWGDPMGNSRFSDRWIEDGSFVRLKRITFSMNLNKWLKSANNSEVYLSGINLITIDKYLGYDPEFAYGGSILWEGIDYCKFPQNKSIMLGVKFGL